MSDEDTDTDAEVMHPAVLLLLARMKSNPQEFKLPFHESHSGVWKYFTKAEKVVVSAADRELVMTRFHQGLMDRILKANDPDQGIAIKVTAHPYSGPLTTSTQLHAQLQQQAMQQALQSGLNNAFSNAYNSAIMTSRQANSSLPNTPNDFVFGAQPTQKGKP